MGVDLFPDGKTCNFDCPYCDVYTAPGEPPFDPAELDREFEEFFRVQYPAFLPDHPLRDIALSGSGEPTLSPHLAEALDSMRRARDQWAPSAGLVLITNSTMLGDPKTAEILGRRVEEAGLTVWAKLDAGGETMYARMSRSSVPFAELTDGLLAFSRGHPVILQTMLCQTDGDGPSPADLEEYAGTVSSLAERGARFREIHLYTTARPSMVGHTEALSDDELRPAARKIAEIVRGVPVRLFGASGELTS